MVRSSDNSSLFDDRALDLLPFAASIIQPYAVVQLVIFFASRPVSQSPLCGFVQDMIVESSPRVSLCHQGDTSF